MQLALLVGLPMPVIRQGMLILCLTCSFVTRTRPQHPSMEVRHASLCLLQLPSCICICHAHASTSHMTEPDLLKKGGHVQWAYIGI